MRITSQADYILRAIENGSAPPAFSKVLVHSLAERWLHETINII
jgi:hypothetical protein